MKKAVIITIIFFFILSIALMAAKESGLHPNNKAVLLMMPLVFAFVWSRVTLMARN